MLTFYWPLLYIDTIFTLASGTDGAGGFSFVGGGGIIPSLVLSGTTGLEIATSTLTSAIGEGAFSFTGVLLSSFLDTFSSTYVTETVSFVGATDFIGV